MPSARARRYTLLLPVGLALLLAFACAAPAGAVGTAIPGTYEDTGEKPQSKLWYNDGTWRAIIKMQGKGLHFYEFDGTTWNPSAFVDAALGAGGQADVKWNGEELFVLAYTTSPKLFKYTYDRTLQVFHLVTGFPVSIAIASGSETMVLDQDSTGRLWATYEGGDGNIYACHSTSADHREWNAPGIVLRSGVSSDDISTVVAFDRKIGIFWSDQARWQFGFRIHRDDDPPEVWQPVQVVASGDGIADDHLCMKADGKGNLYAVTKDIQDEMRLHYRNVSTGKWTTKSGVISGTGTRGIVMVSDQDQRIWVPYTSWSSSSIYIKLRKATYGTMSFSTAMSPVLSGATMNNCTGTKQVLPAGCFMVMAEGGGKTWWNGWGELPPDGPAPPPAPADVRAVIVAAPPAPTTLALGFPFDEGSGTQATADSPGAAVAALRAGTAGDAPPAWSAGWRGSALHFDGESAYAEVAAAAAQRIPGSFTVEAWVRWDGDTSPGTVISKGKSNRRNYQIRVLADGHIDFLWEVSGGTNHGTASAGVLERGRWQHIACVYDSEAQASRIFIDGRLDREVADSGTPLLSDDPLEIGMRFMSAGSPGDFFTGAIDELRVWRQALYVSDFDPAGVRPSAGPSYAPATQVAVEWSLSDLMQPLTSRIYRSVNGGTRALLAADLVATNFVDERPLAGTLCYQISSVDSAGRESKLSAAACVVWSLSGPSLGDLIKPGADHGAQHDLALRVSRTAIASRSRIELSMPQAGRARLAVYDVAGRRVALVHDGELNAGQHTFDWAAHGTNGRLPSGIYFARLEALGQTLREKLLLIH